MRSRLALVLVPLLLVGCGARTGTPRAQDPETREGVGGTYTSDGPPGWARGADEVSLELTSDRMRFSAGCNQFSGPVTWEADGAFEAGPLSGTEMGCEQSAMDADQALVDLFRRADHLELDGNDIEIRAGKKGLWFVPTSDEPWRQPAAVDLAGTQWRLTGIGEYDGDLGQMTSVPEDVTSTLQIDDGQLTFDDGCNDGFGQVRVDGDELVLSDVGATLVGCNGVRGDVEAGVLHVLRDGRVSWHIDGKHLLLLTDDHRYQLDYEAE